MRASNRKVWGDLKRRRARTVLTICTLALAIASLATLAVPGLMDRAMRDEVQATRLHDVAMTTRDLVLSPIQLDALRHLPNVAAMDARVVYSTRASFGGRRQDAVIWGLDLASQTVDTVHLTSGRLPQHGESLGEPGDSGAADLAVTAGGQVEVSDSHGTTMPLIVSGLAHSLATSPSTIESSAAVFYTSTDTVRTMSGMRGVNYLAFRLVDTSPQAEADTIVAVHAYLKSQIGSEPFVDLPVTRASSDWPGRSLFHQITSFFYLITVLAVFCALFLIANVMNTLVAEQSGEIAILKTLGGRRYQIGSIILRTAALLGAAGALLGAGIGVGVAYLLTSFFASKFFGVDAAFAVSVPLVAISFVSGPFMAVVASFPGLRRALRRSIVDTLADRGASGYGSGRLDRLVARSHLLSGGWRMGVRNVLRQKRRSAATIAQVAIATALVISLLAIAQSTTAVTSQIFSALHYDLAVNPSTGAPPLDDRARSIAAGTADIARVEPVLENSVQYQGRSYYALGFDTESMYQYKLRTGRWFTPQDSTATMPMVVLGPAVASVTHARVGQTLTLDTAAGPTEVQVIGIDTNQVDAGGIVYFPLAVLQRLTGMPDATNALWLSTTDSSHATVDRASVAVQDRLAAGGYPVDALQRYVEEANNRAQHNTVITIIEILGLLVVAIAMMGLVSALTMGVIERTREIGILRCLGAQARHVRRVFTAEGAVLTVVGWAGGVPLGWMLFRLLLVFVRHIFGIEAPAAFSWTGPLIALVAVVAVMLVVIRVPLRRAARIRPGAALRYQ